MVEAEDPEVRLALSYASARARRALFAVWALDRRLADIVRATSEPLLGEMRLTWWRDALLGLGTDTVIPAEPLLARLAASAVEGPALAPIAEGWAELLAPMPLDDDALGRYAALRGRGVFGASAAVLGAVPPDALASAGEGWALVDLARHCSDSGMAKRALALARLRLEPIERERFPAALRPIGMLAHLALADARTGIDGRARRGSPKRMWRMMRHRLTGR